MGTRADELKAEIEETRSDLAGTMNAVGDRVNPGRIISRRTDKVRQKVTALRRTVMGGPDGPAMTGGDSGGGAVGSALDGVRQAPQNLLGGTQGAPLAAGLIAFGAGLLLADLLPSSGAEQQATAQVLEKAQPAIEQVRRAAHDMAGDLRESVSDAAQEVKTSATDAASTVGDQAKSAAGEVKGHASEAAGDLKDEARDSASTVKGEAQS